MSELRRSRLPRLPPKEDILRALRAFLKHLFLLLLSAFPTSLLPKLLFSDTTQRHRSRYLHVGIRLTSSCLLFFARLYDGGTFINDKGINNNRFHGGRCSINPRFLTCHLGSLLPVLPAVCGYV